MAEKENKVVEAQTKQAKPEKSKKDKKKGRVKGAWKGFKSELKKIVWPTWKQVLKNTGIVAVIVVACTVAIGALDMAFRTLFDLLVSLF